MIEDSPKTQVSQDVLTVLTDEQYAPILKKINDEYLYWDKVKYQIPAGLKAEDFWAAVRYSRRLGAEKIEFASRTFFFKMTSHMQEMLHSFDTLSSMTTLSGTEGDRERGYYLLSSIMEEAIASSQMEGASTTRKVAKEMLLKQIKPRDKSQQMILNNYNTIRYLVEHKDDTLTPELLLEIQRQITHRTLDDSLDEGRFRTDNNIFVVNGMTGETAHEPPSHTVIGEAVSRICSFTENDEPFIHPVIKAIIIHFMISYLHPFVDGNGRTARSIFYWYMLKKGYRMTQYLSISRIIYRSKDRYEKAFLYTEHDNLDLGYFIQYNLKVLLQAFEELRQYIERNQKQENAFLTQGIPGLNERQMKILKICSDKPSSVFTSKDLETLFGVSVKTVRSDLEGLADAGLMERVALNRRLTGYTRSSNYEERVKELRKR